MVILTNLLSDADVPLADQNARVMNRFGQSEFENLSLKSPLQKVLDFETQNVIEFHLVFWENSDAHQSTQQSVSFEEPFWVLLLERQQSTSDFSDFGDSQFDTPDFTLVTKKQVSNFIYEYGKLNASQISWSHKKIGVKFQDVKVKWGQISWSHKKIGVKFQDAKVKWGQISKWQNNMRSNSKIELGRDFEVPK